MEKQKPKLVDAKKSETPVTDAIKAQLEKKPSVEAKDQVLPAKQETQGLTQREAVYIEVMRVVREEKIAVGEKQAIKPLLSEAHTKKICSALVTGFQSKRIVLKDTEANRQKLADVKVMELYCLGLLNNWLRRDKRLNGVGEAK